MKIKIVLTACLLTFVSIVNAQQIPDLIGKYYQPGTPGDGAGGTYMYLLENNRFAIIAYATFVTGTWQMDSMHVVTLVPKNPEQQFILYGRHNPQLNSGYKLKFEGFEDNPLLMGRNTTDSLQRIFNPDANCFHYPYVYTFNKKDQSIAFTILPDSSYQSEGYIYLLDSLHNDFLAYYINPSQFHKPIQFLAKAGGGLQGMDHKNTMIKHPINEEDLEELNEIEQEFSTAYKPNPSDQYHKISPHQIKIITYKLIPGSLFEAKCE